ncbi:hypothetical protein [Burkholderia pyrrocinia]|nr:hypothetical protein [Burkholderia pyrrocinia]QVN18678.1 hypothetical protein JYG32_02780 [Burkholderia pyrrocinia]
MNESRNKGTRDASWRTNVLGVFLSMKHEIRSMLQPGDGASQAKNEKSPL